MGNWQYRCLSSEGGSDGHLNDNIIHIHTEVI